MIEFIDVSKNYSRGVHALHQANFSIDAGEFVFLIGESGAGKSTVIKLLTCEERPTSGTVVLDNFDVSRMKQKLVPYLRRKIGLIFQDFRLIDSKTVFENVAFAMEIVGAPEEVIERRVPMVLSVVGLRNKGDFYPNELSGGEAQRVGVARAMVNNPRLILADEPTGNLDRENGEAIMALLDEINRAGTTVIACTHDLDTVRKMNKRVIELRNGHVTRDDPPRVEEDFSKNFVSVKPQVSEEMRRLMDDNSLVSSDFQADLGPYYEPEPASAEAWDTGFTPLVEAQPSSDLAPDLSYLEKRLAEDSERRKHRAKVQPRPDKRQDLHEPKKHEHNLADTGRNPRLRQATRPLKLSRPDLDQHTSSDTKASGHTGEVPLQEKTS